MIRRQLAIAAAVVALALLGLFVGAASISPSDVWSALFARLGIGEAERLADAVVWDIRMPRVIGGILVGGALGASGAALQGLLRNSIAEPYLLGLSSAAGFGLVVGAWLTPSGSLPVLAAFLACLMAGATAVLIRRLAAGAVDANSLVLSGIAVGFALLAWTLLLIFSVDSPRLPTFTYFVFGGLGATTWKIVAVGAPLAVVGQGLLVSRSRQLDLVALGDVQAATLGVDVAVLTRVVLAAVGLTVGAAVSIAGVVGFVGLLAPLLGRRMVGPMHRGLIWASVSLGAVIVLAADVTIRALAGNVEIPLGVVTAAVGGPVLVAILLRRRKL